MSPTAGAPVRLRAQVIDNNDGGVGRVRRSCGLSDDDRGVRRGQGICDAPKVSETTKEAAVARRRARGIYDSDRGVDGGR